MQHIYYTVGMSQEHIYYNDKHPYISATWKSLLSKCKQSTLFVYINMKNFDEIEIISNKLLDGHTHIKQIVFDHSADPIYDRLLASKLNTWATNKNIRSFLLTSEFQTSTHSDLTEIVYPEWLFSFKNQKLPDLTQDTKRYLYSCLNRNPTWHRLLFYTMLKKHNQLSNTIYTFYGKNPYNKDGIAYGNQQDFGKYHRESIENVRDFPISWIEHDTQGTNDHSTLHDAYTIAECNIITESTMDVEFTSEKIWKPIASGQCFHIVGSTGTNAWLRSFGFETFDKGYDSTTSIITRLEQLINQLDGNSMWTAENLDKIKHNYHLFHSGDIEETILNTIVDILNN
jgi:hypothetical protein